jgi:hypothetical protein
LVRSLGIDTLHSLLVCCVVLVSFSLLRVMDVCVVNLRSRTEHREADSLINLVGKVEPGVQGAKDVNNTIFCASINVELSMKWT